MMETEGDGIIGVTIIDFDKWTLEIVAGVENGSTARLYVYNVLVKFVIMRFMNDP